MELRPWQDDALNRLMHTQGDYLAVATPGAGKTTFSIVAWQRLFERGELSKLIVVVPTVHLRGQWAKAAGRLGVQLDHTFANANAVVAKDFDGVVVTYGTVAAQPLLWAKLTSLHRTLVIFDEVHHAGEAERLSWGPALKTAFAGATRRLLLSGTPFRSDGHPIPFVQYDEAGRCVPTYNYDYGTALRDRQVVRPIAFPALDGNVRWRDAGAIVSTDLATTDETTLVNALRGALDPTGQWIGSVLRRADEELTRLREEVPDAGGLVVAADQYKARAYADLLSKITGEPPTVAISDEPDASASIDRFARGGSKWIVAVQMVSEGVDIPRLAVGVYASKIKTEMFFRQVVGRFVRIRGEDDELTATMFIPSVQPLLRYAQDIERTVDTVLKEQTEKVRRDPQGDGGQGVFQLDLVQPIDSSEALHHSTVFGGESFTEDELLRAKNLGEQVGMSAVVSTAQLAQFARLASGGRLVGTATIPAPTTPVDRTLSEQKKDLRRVIQRLVGRLSRTLDAPHSHIHADLNREIGDTVKEATVPSLNRRIELLEGKLRSYA